MEEKFDIINETEELVEALCRFKSKVPKEILEKVTDIYDFIPIKTEVLIDALIKLLID